MSQPCVRGCTDSDKLLCVIPIVGRSLLQDFEYVVIQLLTALVTVSHRPCKPTVGTVDLAVS